MRGSAGRSAGFDGALLAAARRDREMSQEALAAAAEVTRSYIIRIEQGRLAPTVQKLARLAKEVGVTPIDLLVIDGTPTLAQLRFCCGLTQRELAAEIGVTDMSYSRFERGETARLRAQGAVEALASTLGVTPETVRAAWERSRAHALRSQPDAQDKGR